MTARRATMRIQNAEWDRTARVVRRLGFGATGRVVDAAVRAGRSAYVDQTLASTSTVAGKPAPAMPDFSPATEVVRRRTVPSTQEPDELAQWWIRRMVDVADPFEEKLTFWWHNHFATATGKVRVALWLATQNATFRRLGRGDFRQLAQAMLIDPAMLYWLDGQANTVQGANENLSREFMELFALGHGDGYTETDVREGARALTGWSVGLESTTATFVPNRHDYGVKTVLGRTGRLNTADFGNAVLARSGSARYVATRFYGQVVSNTTPAPSTVTRLVKAYGAHRDITALLRGMLLDPSFDAGEKTYVVGPLEWLIGSLRALRIPVASDVDVNRVYYQLRELGQAPLWPPDVSGWPSGRAWLSTASIDVKLQIALQMTATADLSFVSDIPAPSRLAALGYRLGIGTWSAGSAAALQSVIDSPPDLVAIALNTPEYLVH